MLQEMILNVRPNPRVDWFWRLRPLAHRLFRLPGVSYLRPLAVQAAAVAAPSGRISFQPVPPCPQPSDGRSLTILSANLYHDWPRYRRRRPRLEAAAQLIQAEAADIVLLQEVSRTADFRSDQWLADRLGMAYLYARANGDETTVGFEEGLAIFSRFPLAVPVLTALAEDANPFARRLGLGAQAILPGSQTLPVFSVHLGLAPWQNAAQLAFLRDWIKQIVGRETAVIGGDFNAHETRRQIKSAQSNWLDAFRHLHPQKDGTTHELRWPWGKSRRRLDYLFLRAGQTAWQVREAAHLDAPGEPHSDHRAVLVRLTRSHPYPA